MDKKYICYCVRCESKFRDTYRDSKYCPECKYAKRERKRRKKSKGLTLDQINDRARAEGLTYGQYVAKYNL